MVGLIRILVRYVPVEMVLALRPVNPAGGPNPSLMAKRSWAGGLVERPNRHPGNAGFHGALGDVRLLPTGRAACHPPAEQYGQSVRGLIQTAESQVTKESTLSLAGIGGRTYSTQHAAPISEQTWYASEPLLARL